MSQVIHNLVDQLLAHSGDTESARLRKLVEQQRNIEQRLLSNPDDVSAWVDYLIELVTLCGLATEPTVLLAPGFRWLSLHRLSDMENDLAEPRAETSTPEAGSRVSLRTALVQQASVQARSALDNVAQHLPPTPANVSSFFELLGIHTYLWRMLDTKEPKAIVLGEYWHEILADTFLRLMSHPADRFAWALRSWQRLENPGSVEALLLRASLLCSLLPDRFDKRSRAFPGAVTLDSAVHLPSIADARSLAAKWQRTTVDTQSGAGREQLLPDGDLLLVRNWVLGDCRAILAHQNVSIAAVHNVGLLLNHVCLITPQLAAEVKQICERIPVLQVDDSRWWLAMHVLHGETALQTASQAIEVVNLAPDDETRAIALTSYWRAANTAGQRESAANVVLSAMLASPRMALDDDVKVDVSGQVLLSVMRPFFKRLKWNHEPHTDYEALEAGAAPIARVLEARHLSRFEPFIDALIGMLKTGIHPSPDREELFDSAFVPIAGYYLRCASDTRAEVLAQTVINCAMQSADARWGVIASLSAEKRGDIEILTALAVRYGEGESRPGNPSDKLLEIILAVSPQSAVRCASAVVGNIASVEVEHVVAGLNLLLGAPSGECQAAGPYVRALIVNRAYNMLKPLAAEVADPFGVSCNGKLLEDAVAMPYVQAMRACMGNDFTQWLKPWAISLIADEVQDRDGRDRLTTLCDRLQSSLTTSLIERLKQEAAAAEAARGKAELEARNRVIQDLSHSVKNVVASIVEPLDNLVAKLPAERVALEKALRGARFIREVINAVNLSSRGSLADFAKDAEDAENAGGTTMGEIVRMSLESACDNMFDTKFFSTFSRNFFPDEEGYMAARSNWQAGKSTSLNALTACLGRTMFNIRVDLGGLADSRIGDARGSRTKLIILLQELLLNAVKYSSFVEKHRREIQFSMCSSDSGMLRLSVRNTYQPNTSTHSTRLGQEIIGNLARLVHGTLDIAEDGGIHAVTLAFPNFFDTTVRERIAVESVKEVQNEGPVR